VIEAIQFLWMVWGAYRRACYTHKAQYVAITERSVPKVACFVGVDREAWRIAQLAVEGWERVL
jgi:hypothetical protein